MESYLFTEASDITLKFLERWWLFMFGLLEKDWKPFSVVGLSTVLQDNMI
jgi:hypothetical protein